MVNTDDAVVQYPSTVQYTVSLYTQVNSTLLQSKMMIVIVLPCISLLFRFYINHKVFIQVTLNSVIIIITMKYNLQ